MKAVKGMLCYKRDFKGMMLLKVKDQVVKKW